MFSLSIFYFFFLFLFLTSFVHQQGIYVGPEVAAGGFLDSYAILTGLMDKGDAALLVSMFWGSLCLGRLIAVPLSIMFKPATMMFINTIGCIFATFLYAIFPENVTMLWLSTFVRYLSIYLSLSLSLAHSPLTNIYISFMACRCLQSFLSLSV